MGNPRKEGTQDSVPGPGVEWETHSTPLPSASTSHEQTDMEPFQLDMTHLQRLYRYLRPHRGTPIGPRKAGSPTICRPRRAHGKEAQARSLFAPSQVLHAESAL